MLQLSWAFLGFRSPLAGLRQGDGCVTLAEPSNRTTRGPLSAEAYKCKMTHIYIFCFKVFFIEIYVLGLWLGQA